MIFRVTPVITDSSLFGYCTKYHVTADYRYLIYVFRFNVFHAQFSLLFILLINIARILVLLLYSRNKKVDIVDFQCRNKSNLLLLLLLLYQLFLHYTNNVPQTPASEEFIKSLTRVRVTQEHIGKTSHLCSMSNESSCKHSLIDQGEILWVRWRNVNNPNARLTPTKQPPAVLQLLFEQRH